MRSRCATACLLFCSAAARAHERWVPHDLKQPIDKSYFQSMRGETLLFSLMAATAIAAILASWYFVAVPVAAALTPMTDQDRLSETGRSNPVRWLRLAVRYFADGEIEHAFVHRLGTMVDWLFLKAPAALLALGVYQNWLFMPSYPLDGSAGPTAAVGQVLRGLEAILALWAASGLFYRALAFAFFAVYGFICASYGLAAIDALPLMASAFYYLFHREGGVNQRQIAGIRLCFGVGFFLLGLVNKIYLSELFIGVGDNFPQLIAGARKLIPGLTREGWSFTTGLGEMTFGLLLLIGVFDKLTCIALFFIFGQMIFVLGPSEIAHLYFFAGLLVLLFHARPGTVLDGLVFRAQIGLWKIAGRRVSAWLFAGAVALVALSAALLLFGPLFFTVHLLPAHPR